MCHTEGNKRNPFFNNLDCSSRANLSEAHLNAARRTPHPLSTPGIVFNFLDYSGTNIYLLLLLPMPFLDLISHFRPEPGAQVGHRVLRPASCCPFYPPDCFLFSPYLVAGVFKYS